MPEVANTNPSDKILRRMGFFNDQDGIMRRYIAEEGGWNEHLSNTKNFIISSLEKERAETLAVLGSGWLLDVPIQYLADNFKKVYLYDIRHPVQIKNKYRDYANLVFINEDLTGGAIEGAYTMVKHRKVNHNFGSLNDIVTVGYIPKPEVDITISVNLLNQLDVLIVEYLRKFNFFANDEVMKFRRRIQLEHLNSLSNTKSVLVTDYQELVYNRLGELNRETPLVFCDLPQGKERQDWVWMFDSQMTYYQNRKTNFKVAAIRL